MKELIRKFEKESGLEIYGLGARRDKWEHCMEKFTELVVKEMCQVIRAEGQAFELDQNFGAVQGTGRCIKVVKQHFGVEE